MSQQRVERSEVLGLADYETIRDRFRSRMSAKKKTRRVKLTTQASCLLKNHDTVLLQVQEALRPERITRERAILHGLVTYNQLVPSSHELSATVLVEIDEKTDRERFLYEAVGLERSFAVIVDGETCPARVDPARVQSDRTTADHRLKFPLGEKAQRAIGDVARKKRKAADVALEVVVEHDRYSARPKLDTATVQALADDLA